METPNKETKYIVGVDKGNGTSKMVYCPPIKPKLYTGKQWDGVSTNK